MYFQKFTSELVRDFEAGNNAVTADKEATIREVVNFIEDMWFSWAVPVYEDITTQVFGCTMKSMKSWEPMDEANRPKVIVNNGEDDTVDYAFYSHPTGSLGIAESCWNQERTQIE